MTSPRNRKSLSQVTRDQVRVGALIHTYLGRGIALLRVDSVDVTETMRLRVEAHVVSRALCAETLVYGETHPTIIMMV